MGLAEKLHSFQGRIGRQVATDEIQSENLQQSLKLVKSHIEQTSFQERHPNGIKSEKEAIQLQNELNQAQLSGVRCALGLKKN